MNRRQRQVAEILSGRDAKLLINAAYEDKTTLLYAFMENYDQTTAQKIQNFADYLSGEALPKMMELQEMARE